MVDMFRVKNVSIIVSDPDTNFVTLNNDSITIKGSVEGIVRDTSFYNK